MRFSILALSAMILFSGCQSFRYYDPAKPHRGQDRFYNNYDNSPPANFWKWQWERLTGPKRAEPPFRPEIVQTDLSYLRQNHKDTTLTWIGHASALLQLAGKNILLDPVFSERVSPLSFIGPKRQVALPFTIAEMPAIDLVLVSHSHYDHLDISSLREINRTNQGRTLFLVPLGNADFLKAEGIENVHELDWWENFNLEGLKLTFTPAQHWTQRTLWDRNKSLWGGWYVQSSDFQFLYTGDTGYSKDFADIRERLGAVDVAMIPVGAYEPRWFMGRQHVDPEGAVKIHKDLGAGHSIGVHWGTFNLSDEPLAAPPEELAAASKKAGLASGEFRVMKHGEIWKIEDKK